jgi:D-glycero-alpha-D-manno-heptose-7-phosphate kinase
MYVTVMRPRRGHLPQILKLEHVEKIDDVQHPIIREAIQMLGFRTPQVEITTLADIPPDRLGSSGSFDGAAEGAVAHRRRLIHPGELAERAAR